MSEPAWIPRFLEALAVRGVLASAARAVGVAPAAVYQLKRDNADFACAVDDAMEEAADTMEQEARRRAIEGVPEPVVYQGQLTPLWERDDDGDVIQEAYEVTAADGKVVTMHRPRQLVVDGIPQFLTVRKHSDSLLMFLLKGRRKAVFADKTEMELTGKGGGPLTHIDETVKAARLAFLLDQAAKRKAQADDLSDIA